MKYDDIRLARVEAQADLDRADQAVCGAVRLIAGRLQIANCNPFFLKEVEGRTAGVQRRHRQMEG